MFNSLWPFLDGLDSIWQNLEPTLVICYAILKTYIAVNTQILNK